MIPENWLQQVAALHSGIERSQLGRGGGGTHAGEDNINGTTTTTAIVDGANGINGTNADVTTTIEIAGTMLPKTNGHYKRSNGHNNGHHNVNAIPGNATEQSQLQIAPLAAPPPLPPLASFTITTGIPTISTATATASASVSVPTPAAPAGDPVAAVLHPPAVLAPLLSQVPPPLIVPFPIIPAPQI